MAKDCKKGFTLIELLVVISIISLLSTVVLASLQNVRRDTKWRAFEKQLIEIRTAVQLYVEKNNGRWPPSFYTNGDYIETLLGELKNSGVYPNSNIVYPEEGVSAYVSPGVKLVNDPNDTNTWGNEGPPVCGDTTLNNQGSSQFAVISFSKYTDNGSVPVNTKFKKLWVYNGWDIENAYCLEIE